MPAAGEGSAFTARGVLIGLIGAAVLGVVTPISDQVVRGTWIACSHLPMAPLVILLLLIAYSTRMRRIASRLSLTTKEMTLVYAMMLCGALIPSFAVTAYLLPTIAGANYFATPENRWASILFRYFPKWLVPFDPHGPAKQEVMRTFYEGLKPGQPIPWGVWITPLIAWGAFSLVVFYVLMCLSAILRRQWVDRERLAFPLVQLPADMLRTDSESLFRQRVMWIGFAVPFLIHAIDGLSTYIPSVPTIALTFPLNQYFPDRPWNQMGILTIWVHFSVIGFSFLLSSELSFSLWFFFVLARVQEVVAAAFGHEQQMMPHYMTQAFLAHQMLGGFLVLAGYLAYLGRHHVRDVLTAAFTRKPMPDDVGEPMSYRSAVWGVLIGTVILSLFLVTAGMSFWLAMVGFFLFYLIAISLTRFVSEGGLLFIQAPFRPSDLMTDAIGTAAMGPLNFTLLTMVERIFIFDLRGFLMPSLLDSYKLADSVKMDRRRLSLALGGAIVVSMVVSFVTMIWIAYHHAGMNLDGWFFMGSPQSHYDYIAKTVVTPVERNWSGIGNTAAGALITLFLFHMRQSFFGWPFHPLGYVMGPSWPMIQLWFSILVGWLAKTLILRYGGMRLFRKARPLFLGLVLGEFSAAIFWVIVDAFLGEHYRLFLT